MAILFDEPIGYPEMNFEYQQLSKDHTPKILAEKQRVLDAGGRIDCFTNKLGQKIGPPRVWLQTKDAPGLAMTRSFGDQTAHTIGCTHVPDISLFSFTKNDRCIILASDGIWQFLSNYDVSLLVYKFYLDHDPEGAAEALIR